MKIGIGNLFRLYRVWFVRGLIQFISILPFWHEFSLKKLFDKCDIFMTIRRAIEDMKREYEEDLERLKKAKDQQIEAAMTSNDTTK